MTGGMVRTQGGVVRSGRRPLCEACWRPAALTALYGRAASAESAILMGRYGQRCFYKLARMIAKHGFQPEREDARVVRLKDPS